MTEQRPIQPTPVGALRFNTDNAKLEYFDGNEYVNITTDSPEKNTGGTRGVFGGGNSDTIDYINISATGNAIDFGNLSQTFFINKALASRVRGIFAGDRPDTTNIEFVTIASTGDSQDFGDLTVSREDPAGVSNGTRGVMGGGAPYPNNVNTIDFITIAQTGNAIDFGDLTNARRHHGSFESPVRGLYAGGEGTPNVKDIIDYIQIATTGNAADFGDLTDNVYGTSGCSNAVRGLFGLGKITTPSQANSNRIDFVTITTLGNSQDFGDLQANYYAQASTSSPTRGIFGGHYPSNNSIDYVQIMTKGNSIDFGDLTSGRGHFDACSNGHGGLG